ncbi:CHASE domain-containing protein [Kangiella marina]|uniref:PAS domain-containing protein n=1 Tax=Kangiella marina TaxID=1079178 RepID=A0ABP8IAL5_9GAMM
MKTTKALKNLHWFHWFVVVSSLLLTLSAWYISSVQLQKKQEAQFNYQADLLIPLVKDRMRQYETALWSGVSNYQSHDNQVSLTDWRKFARSLSVEKRYPGINGIGYITRISRTEKDAYLAEQQAKRPYFKIHPEHEGDELWPIQYIEPEATNAKAVGLDMAHENNRITAAKKARDTGRAQATGPIILVQDVKRTPGFLLFSPLYDSAAPPETLEERRKQFVGLVYAPFVVESLMQGTLHNKNRLVNFRVTDKSEILYDELTEGTKNYDSNPMYSKTVAVPMYGRTWKFTIQSSELFRTVQASKQPLMILVAGIIIDAMLLTLFILLASSSKRASTLAKQMSRKALIEQVKLKGMLEVMSSGVITFDSSNQVLFANRSVDTILGIDHSELVGESLSLTGFQYEPSQQSVFTPKGEQIKENTVTQITIKDGTFLEVTLTEHEVGGTVQYVLELKNIDERVKAQKALAALRKEYS